MKNEATNETAPFHIWKHEVQMAAIALGAASESVMACCAKLQTWYQAGEPVWMAADGLKQLAQGLESAKRSDADGPEMLRAIALRGQGFARHTRQFARSLKGG